MKLSTATISIALLLAGVGSARPIRRDVDPSLIPEFGFQSGINPTGTGDCDGAVNGADGKPIKIPCACPPDRQTFINDLNANVAAGHAVNNPSVKVSFPTDNSQASQLARLNTAAVTLQNLNGPGKGCPVVSTTFSAQQKAIQAGQPLHPSVSAPVSCAHPAAPAPPSSAPSPPTPAPSAPAPSASASGALTEDQVSAVAPPLGFQSGVNPTGTGDCDGAVNGSDGKPIKIPCACPPSQDEYIQQLTANANAGHAINNPTVKVDYPLDNSKQSQLTRLTAASITLQNLHGPGKGCPIVSTTFSAQNQAISNGQPLPPSAAPAPAPSSSAPARASSSAAPVPSSAAAPAPSPSAPAGTNNAVATGGSGALSEAQVSAVAPPLGFQSGINPTGTGDCDGAVNGSDGKPIKIPCACPPSQDEYIQQLTANANAGHAINNPTVKVDYPLDNSKQSQLTRLTAASITLQNLHGPGKGCPIVSTTFSAQNQAISNGQPLPPSAAPAPPTSTSAPVPASSSAVPARASSSAAPASAPCSAAAPASAPSAPAGTNNAVATGGSGALSEAQVSAVAPPLGFQSGINPTGTGDCDGAVKGSDGKPIKIPCACPPSQDEYIQQLTANANAGHAINNPTVKVDYPLDNSKQSQLTRLTAASITLQNLHGPGKGCPIVSTTFSAQNQAISNGQPLPPSAAPAPPTSTSVAPTPTASSAAAPSSAPPAPSPSSTGALSEAQVSAVAPPLGFKSGVNPTGTGDCDGAVNGSDGKPIKIPCACPPSQDEYIQQMTANANAGHAINNPSVRVSYPLDNSKQSQLARLTAASITLQNLHGPGKGCPIVSTTFSAQNAAINAQ